MIIYFVNKLMFPSNFFNPLIYIDSQMYAHCLFIATNPEASLKTWRNSWDSCLTFSQTSWNFVSDRSQVCLQKYFIKTDWIKDISNQWPLDLISFHFVLFSKKEDLLHVRKFCYYPNLPKPIQGQGIVSCLIFKERRFTSCLKILLLP